MPPLVPALLAAVVPLALLAGCGGARTAEAEPAAVTELSEGWRAESFDGVTVNVPETWRPGFSPVAGSDDTTTDLLWCPANPESAAYVGRPLMGTDVCLGDAKHILAMPFEQEALWFDSPMPVGTAERGLVAETVEVGPTRLTVVSDDEGLRDRILAGVRVVTDTDPNGCPVVPVPPDVDAVDPGEVRSLAVCVYDHDEKELIWSGTRTAADAGRLLAAVREAPTMEVVTDEREPFQTISLVLVGDREVTWNVLPDLGRMYADGRQVALSADLVRPWAGDAIKAYVVGGVSAGPDQHLRFFRGLIG